MKELELYDIITLDNGNEYTVLKSLEKHQQKYYLLAPVDEKEEIDMDHIRIVKEIIQDDIRRIQEETDEEKIKLLAKEFLTSLTENLN